MKKLFALLLSAVLAASFTACSSGTQQNETAPAAPEETPKEETQAEGNSDTAADAGDLATVTGGKLIMSTEAGFAPYEYVEGENVVGIDVDIAGEIAKQLGLELEIQDVDFTNALLAPQQGKSDFAAAGISITEDRKQSMDFTIEYAESKQVIVVKKGDASITDEASMMTKNVGVQQGTTADLVYGDEEAYPGAKVERYKKYLVAADDLKNGKIDCIVMDELPAQMIVDKNAELEILGVELFTDKYAFAVKKGNQALLDKINPVLEQMIQDGKIKEYTAQHMANAL